MTAKNSVITLSRFRADVGRALGRRGEKMLEAANLSEQMAALQPLEAYFIIKELGVEDALPLLKHSTDEQLQAFIDLDCWEGDDFSPLELDAWLGPFSSEGADALATAFLRLDEEVQILTLAAHVAIYDVRNEEAPAHDSHVRTMHTPDNFFELHLRPEAEQADLDVDPFVLIAALYRQDMPRAVTLMMAAKWELPSGMTEQALHFRNGRLGDLGFPDQEVAARLFAKAPTSPPPEVESLAPSIQTSLPALYAIPMDESSLFTLAMMHLVDSDLVRRLEADLVFLVNAAVVAYGESPRDLAHVTAVAERVRDTLSLGLEVLLPQPNADAVSAAAALLHRWPLLHIFQHGQGQLEPLRLMATTLLKDPVIAAWLNLATNPDDDPEAADRAFLRYLTLRHPLSAGFNPLRPEQTRAFATRNELQEATMRLEALGTRLT